MLPALIAQIGIPALLDLIGKGLDKVDNPAIKQAAGAIKDASRTLGTGGVPIEQLVEANRHIEVLAAQENLREATQLTQINESLRAEVSSNDWYVRRMRPTFGYLMAITWACQMLALAYAIVFAPETASLIMQSMESLGLIWSVGLSVLGIYVYKRSEEKRLIG